MDIKNITKIVEKIRAKQEGDFYPVYMSNSPNWYDVPNIIPFRYAMMSVEDFKDLYEKDPNIISERDLNKNSVLHYAVKLENTQLVEFLASGIIPIDQKNYSKHTALKFAVEDDYLEITQILLKAGANPNSATTKTNLISLTENEEMKNLLLEYGCIEAASESAMPEFLQQLENFFIEKNQRDVPINLHLAQDQCMDTPTIPHKVHYIWLTDSNNPKNPPEKHLSIVNASMTIFQENTQYDDWSYSFHTNAPEGITNTTSFFKSLGFQIIDINQEYKNFKSISFVDLFIQTKNYGIAADLARYEVINLEGGVYIDLNFNLTRALDKEFCAYSFVNFETTSTISVPMAFPHAENYFFISKPNHPILIQTINDVYSAFHGPASHIYFSNLNGTNREATDVLFSKFSFNNVANLTSNGEKGIIYRFDAERNQQDNEGQNKKDMDICINYDNPHITAEQYARISKIAEAAASLNLVCTNPYLIPEIGYDDSLSGQSWMNSDSENSEN